VEDLIFIDESGVNLAMLRLYARALKGKRARGEKPQKRGQNISIISALSLRKVLASSNIYGCVDAVTFKDLINGIFEAMLTVTQQDIHNWFTHCCYCTS
jgi:hypothetical protein